MITAFACRRMRSFPVILGKRSRERLFMPNHQSPLRRSLAILATALLAVAWAAGMSIPAGAAPVKGSLDIVSVTDNASALAGPVQNRPFNVAVRVLDGTGLPTTVNQATTVALDQVSGPGVLGGTTTAVIPRNGSGVTITGATYSQFANGVVLRVRATSGVQLNPDTINVDVALRAVGADAAPHRSVNVTDPTCGAPTAEVPNCGQLVLPNGASGHVTVSVGSCDGLGACKTEGTTKALVVTAIANLKDGAGNPLYNDAAPATLILACAKDLCRTTANGVSAVKVIYTLNNTGALTTFADPCPAKGVLGAGQPACVDYVQSSRSAGDLYMYLLFDADLRGSFP
jgi:hypothetical protein